jgi:hypothetical protein
VAEVNMVCVSRLSINAMRIIIIINKSDRQKQLAATE